MQMNENEKQRLARLLGGALTDSLIEELIAMANDKQRQQFPFGIDLTPRDPLKPPVTLDWPNDNEAGTLLRINRGGFSFDLRLNADNSLSFEESISGDEPGGGGGGSSPVSGSGGIPGRIDAYLGSNQYTVTIYPSGLLGSSSVVTVTQLNGDAAYPHTADGTLYAIVTRAGTTYYMNLPTWE